MSRYGFSRSREEISPYSSMSGGAPAVTDDDFSYITSQDLDEPGLGDARHMSQTQPNPDDDVLLVKHKGITYPAHFPAYAIGDGKLRVKDVRDRVGLMMGLPERSFRRAKLLYKGRQLKDATAPVRDYGVKNKSELMVVLPEGGVEDSSPSEEEMVIVGDGAPSGSKSGRRKKRRNKKTGNNNSNREDGDSASSPRDSASNADPSRSPEPGAAASKRLDELSEEFNTKFMPICDQYFSSPPSDQKKREDEHRRISETILQHILLKLDEVETEGVPEIRARRKELVQTVQAVLKKLDTVKGGS